MTEEPTIDERNQPRPAGPQGEATLEAADQGEIPADSAGGPPRIDDLTMSPSEMGMRVLEDATQAPARVRKQDDDRIDPDTLPSG